MRTRRLSAGWLVVLAAAQASGGTGADSHPIVVNMLDIDFVPLREIKLAESRAASVLAPAGVKVMWRHQHVAARTSGTGPSCGIPDVPSIDMAFLRRSQRDEHPGALGLAKPFESNGVRILIFYDRLNETQRKPNVLGHVLAHEIGHMLLRTNLHRDTGLMRAHWSPKDLDEMISGFNLPFCEEDRNAIRQRLASPAAPFSVPCSVADGPPPDGRGPETIK